MAKDYVVKATFCSLLISRVRMTTNTTNLIVSL